MFADYTSLVMAMYREKAASGVLSTRLCRPTAANIRDECLAVCKERFSKADEGILKTFFGANSDKESYLKAIQRCETDKFRPLINFIRERTSTPAEINIELLAWLIDFNPRPFQLGRNYASEENFDTDKIQANGRRESTEETGIVSQQVLEEGNNREEQRKSGFSLPVGKDSKSSETNKIRKWAIFFLAGIICLGLLYAIIPQKQKSQMELGNPNTGCMYWTGDHYEVSPCIQRGPDTVVVAIDPARLNNFKRIDTGLINKNSIGRVWYRIKDRVYYFYSAPGKDPVDGINLRRLTDSSYAKFERTYRK